MPDYFGIFYVKRANVERVCDILCSSGLFDSIISSPGKIEVSGYEKLEKCGTKIVVARLACLVKSGYLEFNGDENDSFVFSCDADGVWEGVKKL